MAVLALMQIFKRCKPSQESLRRGCTCRQHPYHPTAPSLVAATCIRRLGCMQYRYPCSSAERRHMAWIAAERTGAWSMVLLPPGPLPH